MAQRQLFRGACRVLQECQLLARSSGVSKHGSSGTFAKASGTKLQASPVWHGGLAACPVLRSLTQGTVQVSAFPVTVPLGFAASALSASGPLSVLGSSVQQRGLASTDGTDDADGDDSDPTYLRPVADSQTPISPGNEDEEPPDLRALRSQEPLEGDGRPGRGSGPRGGGGGGRGGDEPLSSDVVVEALIAAREVFTRQPDSPGGPLPALPREVREALYGHRWDRLLVDVKRSVARTALGKKEMYTAMVATGNLAGVLGLGLGVAPTAQLAVARAHLDSYSRLTAVPLYRGHTIYHQVDHTLHETKIRLMPRPEGWGVRASDLMYELCSLVGIRNISVKLIKHTKNKFFMAKCFQEALLRQTTPHDGVEATGMYIREVYYKKELPYGLKRGVDIP